MMNYKDILLHKHFPRYQNMIQRCYNPKNKSYISYGQRGIYVCESWLNDFWDYTKWVDEHYVENYHIDRINNDGPYSPDNCRFITQLGNQHNKRNVIQIYAFGETKCAYDWAKTDKCSISSKQILRRIRDWNWTPEDAISLPNDFESYKYELNGKNLLLHEWVNEPESKVNLSTLRKRLSEGWDFEVSLTLSSTEARKRKSKLHEAFGLELSIPNWAELLNCDVSRIYREYKKHKNQVESFEDFLNKYMRGYVTNYLSGNSWK